MCTAFLRFDRCRLLLIIALISFLCGAYAEADDPAARNEPGDLKICSDPNNLPFSNDKLQGFENKIADVIARELGGQKIEYTWRAQRRGFFREAFKACDLVMGVPAGSDLCLTTTPYYCSSYAFVSRTDKSLGISTLDDPRLKDLKIGVQVAIESATPPAQALARRGIIQNLVGYSLVDDYSRLSPISRIIQDVSEGTLDLAIAWGPLAGYFSQKQGRPLTITMLSSEADDPLRMAYDISIGVSKTKPELLGRINKIIEIHHGEINQILDEYYVPRQATNGSVTRKAELPNK